MCAVHYYSISAVPAAPVVASVVLTSTQHTTSQPPHITPALGILINYPCSNLVPDEPAFQMLSATSQTLRPGRYRGDPWDWESGWLFTKISSPFSPRTSTIPTGAQVELKDAPCEVSNPTGPRFTSHSQTLTTCRTPLRLLRCLPASMATPR